MISFALLVCIATYLCFPLARTTIDVPKLKTKRKVTLTDDQLLQFALAYRLEMESGALCESGLVQALHTLPLSALPETREALHNRVGVSEAMHKDAKNYPLLRDLSLALALSQKQGSQLGVSLRILTDSIRERIEIHQILRNELASVKATIAVLVMLPVMGMGFATFLGARPMHWLVNSSFGRGCFAVALILEMIGILWTRALINRAIREPQ